MAGIRALRKIQFGLETTPGTAVAATHVWRGTGTLKDEKVPKAVKEEVGANHSLGLVYYSQAGAVIKLASTPASFEQLPYILATGVEDTTTGAADGSGSGKIYQFDSPVGDNAASNDIATLTVRAGDNQRVDVAEYVFCESFKIKGAKGGPVTIEAALRGRQATDGDFTTGIDADTVEPILFGAGKLYLDADGGTIGTTLKSATLLGFEFGGDTGWIPLWTADGALYFAAPVYVGNNADTGGKALTGKLMLVHNSNAETELAAARAGTVRLMRLKFEGSALTTPGTTYTYKTFILDAAIQYTDVPDLGEEDDLDVLELPFRVVENDARNLSWSAIVVNEVSALS